MRFQKGTEQMFIDMWMNFIDPYNQGFVKLHDLLHLFEHLARGRLTKEPTLVSTGFSNAIGYAIQTACGFEADTFEMSKIRGIFEDHTLNINLLNQTLKVH